MEELTHEEEFLTAVKQKAQIKELTKSPLWANMLVFVQDQVKRREDFVLSTAITSENIGEVNTIRGEILGLKLLENWIKDQFTQAGELEALFNRAKRMREEREESDAA